MNWDEETLVDNWDRIAEVEREVPPASNPAPAAPPSSTPPSEVKEEEDPIEMMRKWRVQMGRVLGCASVPAEPDRTAPLAGDAETDDRPSGVFVSPPSGRDVVHVADDRSGLIVITVSEPMSRARIRRALRGLDAILLRRQDRYALLVDASQVTRALTLQERTVLADWINEYASLLGRRCVGIAVVHGSEEAATGITELRWRVPAVCAGTMVARTIDGLRFCAGRLQRVGIPVSGRLRELVAPEEGEDHVNWMAG